MTTSDSVCSGARLATSRSPAGHHSLLTHAPASGYDDATTLVIVLGVVSVRVFSD